MFKQRLEELHSLLNTTVSSTCENTLKIDDALKYGFELISECNHKKGNVFVIGNGGSSSIASHFTTDLVKALKIGAICFADASLITCLSNDLGYENVYSLPLKHIIKKNDILVAISSSGQSENILRAVQVAKELECKTITLSGFLEDNPLRMLGDLNFYIDKSDYGLVEIAHSFILHSVIDLWKHFQSEKAISLLNKASSHAQKN